MTREFITYNQALALKELGFKEPCMAIYYSKDKSFSWHHHKDHTNDEPALDSGEFNISAPTYSAAFRWFRGVHELEGVPQKADSFFWFKFCIWKYTSNGKHRVNDAFDFEHKTYEEAEQACLDKLIEICKTK